MSDFPPHALLLVHLNPYRDGLGASVHNMHRVHKPLILQTHMYVAVHGRYCHICLGPALAAVVCRIRSHWMPCSGLVEGILGLNTPLRNPRKHEMNGYFGCAHGSHGLSDAVA